ncbi:MAG: hypothetical protein K9J16_15080 [Melioribacteraceae bacterium]|nr:hypothetical protein [Melioribacteraceae bacterium]MCF8355922.1 hypothetical protein [Melioribacteraceae bacterium]MCF8395462.1 hypothetical protein [Melioribacteraceae bacterium]MCF8420784.1 hypothetical protein [Melioribacteraceae bacterium]
MKWKSGLLVLLITIGFAACSTFSELEPDPEIFSEERGYIELKNDDENFELEKDGKYFIKFPKAQSDNFYLVLKLSNKNMMTYYFTNAFDDGEGDIVKINDEASSSDEMSVYEIGRFVDTYYWVIDNVQQDMFLSMEYRYVPIWRFKFENKYSQYKSILQNNKIDRNIYNSIDEKYDVSDLNFAQEIALAKSKNANLVGMKDEFLALENIFPADISRSTDEAYVNFVDLRNNLDDELEFQTKYLAVLNAFKEIAESKNNPERFASNISSLLSFIKSEGEYRPGIIAKAKMEMANRMPELIPYYETILRRKNDYYPIELDPSINDVKELYSLTAGRIPDQFNLIVDFINRFNQEAIALQKYENQKAVLDQFFDRTGNWPPDSFYPDASLIVEKMEREIPRAEAGQMDNFRTYNCAVLLSREIVNASRTVYNYQTGFQKAAQLVPQINVLRSQGSYRDIIEILINNKSLGFLIKQYSDIDQLSLTKQKNAIASNLENNRWAATEAGIKNLYQDQTFVNLGRIQPRKNEIAAGYENQLFEKIKIASRTAVDTFVAKNKMVIENVKDIYENSSFTPVHTLNFSTGGQAELQRKKKEISDYLDRIKYYELPESSIRSIYDSFLRNPSDEGVLKGRAIVAHGKYYRGNDSKIKNLVSEFDITVPKWITKPKEYRKVFVLPTSTNQSGSNEYMFRLQLQIPSEAQFPVYEINIKLPEEVAEDANFEKWYDVITLDGTEIKNEGRIKITSPTPTNDFEAQISPVQMEKEGSNILEVRFTHNSFKVFEVSTMAQKPIIKKN